MRNITESSIDIKPIVQFLQEQSENTGLNEGLRDWAIAGLEWVKKTYHYLKNTIAQCGKYFVAIIDGEIAPVVMPITGQQAYMNGLVNKKVITHVGNSEDKKYSKINTNENTVLAKYPTFLEQLKSMSLNESEEVHEIDWSQIDEKYLDPEFVKNGYMINEDELNSRQSDLDSRNSEMSLNNVDDKELMEDIQEAIDFPEDVSLMIWGAPGIGKTQIVKRTLKMSRDNNARFIDCAIAHMTEDDFFLPAYDLDEAGNRVGVKRLPLSHLPLYLPTGDRKKDKELDAACGSGILFLDEITRAKEAVLNICLKLINDRILDQYKLGSGWAIICAGNRSYDEPGMRQEMNWTSALGNRMDHVTYSPAYKDWRKWAETKGYMDRDVLDFLELEENTKFFYQIPDTDENEEKVYPSPRSWTRMCIRLANLNKTAEIEGFNAFDLWRKMPRKVERVLGGTVGASAAAKFMQYLTLKSQVDIKKLKLAWEDAKNAPLPKKSGKSYSLDSGYIFITTICSMMKHEPTPEEFSEFADYLIRLDDESLMSRALTLICQIHPGIVKKSGERTIKGLKQRAGQEDPEKYLSSFKKLMAHYKEFANTSFRSLFPDVSSNI